jgi:hypothetical protein
MRRRASGSEKLRAAVAAKLRAFAEEWAGRLGLDVRKVGGYVDRADALDRGEPVLVASWEIPSGLRAALGVAGTRHYVLEPDGMLHRYEA